MEQRHLTRDGICVCVCGVETIVHSLGLCARITDADTALKAFHLMHAIEQVFPAPQLHSIGIHCGAGSLSVHFSIRCHF